MNLPKRLSGRRRQQAERPGQVAEAGGARGAGEYSAAGGLGAERLAYLGWVADTVREHGWAVCGINAEGQAPPWAYSVGLWLTCQSVELVTCGIPLANAAGIINALGGRLSDGAELAPGDVVDDLCPARLALRPVDASWRTSGLLAVSDTFYGMVRPPYLQVVWSDKEGRFPWDSGFAAAYRDLQPMLWLPRDDNPPGPWTRLHAAD